MLSDLIKSLIEVSLNSLTEVGEVVLVLWTYSSEAQYSGSLLVDYFAQPGSKNDKEEFMINSSLSLNNYN